ILAAKTATAAAKNSPTQYTEQQRVQKLESWRTPENSHLIDEAISSGETPEDAALRILKASMEQEKAVSQMVDYAHEIINRRNGRR
uniref:hypothetical protein n=1 Tax=Paenibacillus sp. USDA918EY TaxID=2689575 RepID=UPI001F26CF83